MMRTMTSMKMTNTSGFLCEQPDLHPVSPNFALCAVCLVKAGSYTPKMFSRCWRYGVRYSCFKAEKSKIK